MKISIKCLFDDNLDSHKKSKNNYFNVVIKFEDLNQQDKILSCNKKHTIIMHIVSKSCIVKHGQKMVGKDGQ